MSSAKILVLGGSGFVGRYLVPRLDEAGHVVTVPTRNRERARHLVLLPKANVTQADIHDDEQLDQLVAGQDVVVNLIGILHGRLGDPGDPYGPDFRAVHVDLMQRLVRCAQKHGVSRIVQISALGVTDNDPATLPSRYLRSKATAEKLLRAAPIPWVVFRPSVIFGPGDSFLSLFANLQRWAPVVAVPHPDARFQPVYVGDVADAIVKAIDDAGMVRRTFELAGPDVYTLRELVHLAGLYGGHERAVFGLPTSLGHIQAMVMEKLPGRTVMSRDNLMSLKVDNVASGPIDPRLGIEPLSVQAIAPTYLRPIDSQFNAERRARR